MNIKKRDILLQKWIQAGNSFQLTNLHIVKTN